MIVQHALPTTDSQPIERPPLAPLFRWPGGKRWLLPRLLELVPATAGRFFEPFFGAGALFFALRPTNARISDKNDELMSCFRAIRDDPAAVEERLRKMGLDKDSYYAIREVVPTDDAHRAARLIYLTTHAFNGIYRVNKQGQFNVPYGGRRYEDLGAEGRLRPYSEALQGIEITSDDFEVALDSAVAGDVLYLDPPYTVRHSNNGFLKYNDRIFLWKDQERLAQMARDLSTRGCSVIVSNAHHTSIDTLYPDFNKIVVPRASVMASDTTFRGPITEYILTNVG